MAGQPQGVVRMNQQPIGSTGEANGPITNQNPGATATAQDMVKVNQQPGTGPQFQQPQQYPQLRRAPSLVGVQSDLYRPQLQQNQQPVYPVNSGIQYRPRADGTPVNSNNTPPGPRLVQQPGGGPPVLRRIDSRNVLPAGTPPQQRPQLPPTQHQQQHQQQQQQHQQQQQQHHHHQQQQQQFYSQQQFQAGGIQNRPPLPVNQQRFTNPPFPNSSNNNPVRGYDPRIQTVQQLRPTNPGQLQNRPIFRNPSPQPQNIQYQQTSQIYDSANVNANKDAVPDLVNGGMGNEGTKLQGQTNRSYSVSGTQNNTFNQLAGEEDRRQSIAFISNPSLFEQQHQQQIYNNNSDQGGRRLFSLIKGRLHSIDGKPGILLSQQQINAANNIRSQNLLPPNQSPSRISEIVRKMDQTSDISKEPILNNGSIDSVKSGTPPVTSRTASASSNISNMATPVERPDSKTSVDEKAISGSPSVVSTSPLPPSQTPQSAATPLPSSVPHTPPPVSTLPTSSPVPHATPPMPSSPLPQSASSLTSKEKLQIEKKESDSKSSSRESLEHIQNDKTPDPMSNESGLEEGEHESRPASSTKLDESRIYRDDLKSASSHKSVTDSLDNNVHPSSKPSSANSAHVSRPYSALSTEKDRPASSQSVISGKNEILVNGHISVEDEIGERSASQKEESDKSESKPSSATIASKAQVNGYILDEDKDVDEVKSASPRAISASSERPKSSSSVGEVPGSAGSATSSRTVVIGSPRPSSGIPSPSLSKSPEPESSPEKGRSSVMSNKELESNGKSPSPSVKSSSPAPSQDDQLSDHKLSSKPISPLPPSPQPEEVVEGSAEDTTRPKTPATATASPEKSSPLPDKISTPTKSRPSSETKLVFESKFSEDLHFKSDTPDTANVDQQSRPETGTELKVAADEKSRSPSPSASDRVSETKSPVPDSSPPKSPLSLSATVKPSPSPTPSDSKDDDRKELSTTPSGSKPGSAEVTSPKSATESEGEKSPSAKAKTLPKSPKKRVGKRASSLSAKTKEGDHDSGVDETTQGQEPTTNGDVTSPQKSPSKIPGAKKSVTSPTKTQLKSPVKSTAAAVKSPPKTAETAPPTTAEKKKVPMNKVQVGAAPSPNLKAVRSKIGSLDNASYKPGGGKVKIEHRKLDFSKTQPKIAAKNDAYIPGGGDKKITQVKLQWNAKPKVGSLENATHKPGGGDKKIESVKLDFKDKAKPKVGSKDNVKHTPGGGSVKNSSPTQNENPSNIENQKIEFSVESKVGSLANVKHKPGGGDKKIFDDKTYLRQVSSTGGGSVASSEGRASGAQTPELIGMPSHETSQENLQEAS